ncbi:MAG: DsbC family protein [Gammaproteobacteria bacterium]|nr:DsbC family protein [Gammaproteobacteria bacterium]
MKLLLNLILAVLVMGINPAMAAEESADIKQLRAALVSKTADAANLSIKTTPMPGMYEVIVGARVLYMSKDARYVFDGDIFDYQKGVNLTEPTRGLARKAMVDELGEENMVVYKPEGEVKHTLTVFTDIYCPYCVRLHREMDEYMAQGVKVRYIFVPFKGKKSFDTSVSVWCAKDQNKAMDEAKAGDSIESKTCDNPVERHRALATVLGIRGTPAMMFDNGKLNPGYVPVARAIQQMESMGL